MKFLTKLTPVLLLSLFLSACGKTRELLPAEQPAKKAAAPATVEPDKATELLKKKNAELSQAARYIEEASGEHFGSLAFFEESMGVFEKGIDGFYSALMARDPKVIQTKAEKVVSDYLLSLTYLASLEEANLKLVDGLLGSVGKFSADAGERRKVALETFQSELKAAQNKLTGIRRLLAATLKQVRAETTKVLGEETTTKVFSGVK